ncbi:hypothetical protein G9C98_005589 [Cotesia typhae]|uniref:Uncharacterized protein n=2 Tax=Braconidae TaxID=7402 RepID=A0A8J5R4A3_9HYME|nr:hypothetical protein G9C98_005589 [Cotesia typhae]
MASQTQGIQQLLAAEKKAADKVTEARKPRLRLNRSLSFSLSVCSPLGLHYSYSYIYVSHRTQFALGSQTSAVRTTEPTAPAPFNNTTLKYNNSNSNSTPVLDKTYREMEEAEEIKRLTDNKFSTRIITLVLHVATDYQETSLTAMLNGFL